jgi:hypothetical protein
MSGAGLSWNEAPVLIERMSSLIDRWSAEEDRRDVFLRCYRMMTVNMHEAIDRGEFSDGPWVATLLQRFAGYYFDALEQWERGPTLAPPVWQLAHESTRLSDAAAWRHLLLGVNAHINFDLVLTLQELLDAEWSGLSATQRTRRYEDYCRVNAIIAATIDAVQDQILAPDIPFSALLDRVLGRLDEYIISRVITSWRDQTWENAVLMLDNPDPAERELIIRRVEADSLRLAGRINTGRTSEE